MKEFAMAEWRRACRAISSAKQLLETDPEASASRSYYAAFHALTALFAVEDRTSSKHSEIRAAIHRDLVKPGRFPPEVGRDFDFLLDLRESADYGGISEVASESASVAIGKAESILEDVKKAVPDLD